MKWITRKDIKVDRVACPWLIRHFVDPDAQFLFVEEDELLAAAQRENAIPYDAPRIREVKLNHRGERCTFEAIIEDYKLQERGLERLAAIVRAADVKGQEPGYALSLTDLPRWEFLTRSGFGINFLFTMPSSNTHERQVEFEEFCWCLLCGVCETGK
jgi:hypothetical protein